MKEAQPRKRFQFQTYRVQPPKIPKARDLHMGPMCVIKPPDQVVQLLGNSELIVGVDIETHDWENNAGSKGGFGQYGFYGRCNSNDHAARIVQIGWAISKGDAAMVVKERLVKPDGFRISDKAEKFHGISNTLASSQGQQLKDVMREFMDDMIDIYNKGGRVVIHHLEFDAGIINRELDRASLSELQEIWAYIARGGLCTMDPGIGKWVRQCLGMEIAPYHNSNTMKLNDMLEGLVPQRASLMSSRHSAGVDAQLHVMLYRALLQLMQKGGGV